MNAEELMKWLEGYGANTSEVMERFLGDTDLYLKCLDSFLRDEDAASFDALGTTLNEQDYQKAFEIAHTLKGVTGNLGLKQLYESICVLVNSLRTEHYDSIEVEYATVMANLASMKESLS